VSKQRDFGGSVIRRDDISNERLNVFNGKNEMLDDAVECGEQTI